MESKIAESIFNVDIIQCSSASITFLAFPTVKTTAYIMSV
jgi:hypothetical protein